MKKFFLFLTLMTAFSFQLIGADTGAHTGTKKMKSFKNDFVSFQYPASWILKNDSETNSCALSFRKKIPNSSDAGNAIEFTLNALVTTETVSDDDLREMSKVDVMGTLDEKTTHEKKVSSVGQIKGNGLEISGKMVDGKSSLTVLTFDHKLKAIKTAPKKDPNNPFDLPVVSPNHLFISGYYVTSYDNQPVLTPEESEGIKAFLNSLQTTK
ncbi:MAG: hypothetical protein IPJ69_09225 [Deltaproteobacteria bacterium]|nr:MAG: hypothetical protein IPJ69_09225 [Deltaproteobacteria bacterium]